MERLKYATFMSQIALKCIPYVSESNSSPFNMKFGIILIIYMYTCVHITCTFSYLYISLLILSFDCEFYNDYNFPPILLLPHLPSCILW